MTETTQSDARPLFKISFPLPPDEPGGAETMWGEPLDQPFAFRLVNTPLYAPGLGNGDVIQARDEDGVLTFDSVVKRGGHSTYRVAMTPTAQRDRAAQLANRLLIAGSGIERSSETFFAVDVPPDADIYKVYEILREGLDEGTWWFDEMHVGHDLRRSQGSV